MFDETETSTRLLFHEYQLAIQSRTDHLFAGLMVFQWLASIAAAYWISPLTWAGSSSQPHIHLWAAVMLGGAITCLPVNFALILPGAVLTRHVVAIGQMLLSALLIHLSGGRIETHFHIFGSLAFLAFYRDWRVLITAAAVTTADHFIRGIYWPFSIFGVLTASPWRPVEHAAWVVFTVIFLAISCVQGTREMWVIAHRQARDEAMNTRLTSLIGRVRELSVSLMTTATEIAVASKQQEQTVHDYSASTNEAVAAINEISATSIELLKAMNEVNQIARRTAQMTSTGKENLAGMDRTMRQLAESTGSIGAKLSVISERAANINLVVTAITKVADQTNLLSINAAIEAEKAGEYGLGFLVVAREIRRLADQTSVATLDIERMVKEMQYSVSAGVMEMDKFSEQVRQVVHEMQRTGGHLSHIIADVTGLDEHFEVVTEGMRVQSVGAEQIRVAMLRLSEGANQTSISVHEFNTATDSLRDAVGGLKEEVSRFQADPEAPGQSVQAA